MIGKRLILGLGAMVLVVSALLGVACGDDEDNGNGNGTPEPTATQSANGDETPAD